MATTESVSINGRFGPLDDLVRRKLMVSNSTSAEDVKNALLKQYPMEKSRMEQEAAGFAASWEPQVSPSQFVKINVTEEELIRTNVYLSEDLHSVIKEPAFRNFSENLEGLGRSLVNSIDGGISAARSSSDSGFRDRVFSSRRILSDYARAVRYLGIFGEECRAKCRRLSQSIDRIASYLLVIAGQSKALQAAKGVSASISVDEIETRREATLNALSNLLGTNEEGYDDETYGRRTIGFQKIYTAIEDNNQHDLKVLLQKSELNRMLGELVDQISKEKAMGIVAFNPSVEETIEKVHRLISVAASIQADQPPLLAFLNELSLFSHIAGSRYNRIGMRLIDLAQSPITYYGGNFGNLETNDIDARWRLVKLTFERSRLSDIIDRESGGFNRNDIRALDQITGYVDRAVDYYCLGTENWGNSENRAAVYSEKIKDLKNSLQNLGQNIQSRLIEVCGQIHPSGNNIDPNILQNESCLIDNSEERYNQMLKLLTAGQTVP